MQQFHNEQDCKRCRGLLFDYVTDVTGEVQSAFVRQHLTKCDACKSEYDEICTMLSVLHEAPVPKLPKGFQLSLHQKLVQAADEMQKKKENSFLGKLKKVGSMGGWKVVAPALVCFVLVVSAYSGGVFEKWQNADSMLIMGEATQPPKEELPVATDMPQAVETEKPVVQSQKTVEKTEKPAVVSSPKVEITPEPVKEEPVTNAEPEATEPPVQEHTPMIMSYRMADRAAVTTNYSLAVSGTIEEYLDACASATSMRLKEKATITEQTAILHLSETEWETFSQYITTTDATLTLVTEAEEGADIVVEIQGYEG